LEKPLGSFGGKNIPKILGLGYPLGRFFPWGTPGGWKIPFRKVSQKFFPNFNGPKGLAPKKIFTQAGRKNFLGFYRPLATFNLLKRELIPMVFLEG